MGLQRKSYGRIYVQRPEDVQAAMDIVREIDEEEFRYMPHDMIAPFSEYPKVAYTHKFCDLDWDKFTATCWDRGIPLWIYNSGREHPEDKRAQRPA